MFDITIELHTLNALLERITIALERLAGPVTPPPPPPRMSDMSDYYRGDPALEAAAKQAKEEFATAHMVVPGSEAFVAAVKEYEQQILNSYGLTGPEIVKELPWNKRRTPTTP